jgi:hypothetical protein
MSTSLFANGSSSGVKTREISAGLMSSSSSTTSVPRLVIRASARKAGTEVERRGTGEVARVIGSSSWLAALDIWKSPVNLEARRGGEMGGDRVCCAAGAGEGQV